MGIPGDGRRPEWVVSTQHRAQVSAEELHRSQSSFVDSITP